MRPVDNTRFGEAELLTGGIKSGSIGATTERVPEIVDGKSEEATIEVGSLISAATGGARIVPAKKRLLG